MSYSSELVHTIIEFFYAIFMQLSERRQLKESEVRADLILETPKR
jgi:hypothetical protein